MICATCQEQFKSYGKQAGYEVLYIYNDFFRQLLFRFKACGDLALAPVFLNGHEKRLQKKYKDFIIVPAPSNDVENKQRGFLTLVEIFVSLKLQILPVLYKDYNYKQALKKGNDRQEVYKVIKIKNKHLLKGKKVLFVDDLTTSGHTMNACLSQIQTANPACIAVLILAKKKG